MDVRYGARPLRRALQKEIEDKLADLYLEGTFSAGDHILIDVLSGDFSFSRLKEADTENMVPVQEEQESKLCLPELRVCDSFLAG